MDLGEGLLKTFVTLLLGTGDINIHVQTFPGKQEVTASLADATR